MSGMIAFERMLSDIGDYFESEFTEVDGWTVYTDDVTDAGVFVAGEGQCGRIPVADLHHACLRADKRSDRSIVVHLVERHVG